MGLFFLIPVLYLIITGWVSYYTAASVHKSLKANQNANAGLYKWMIFIVLFIALVALGVYLVAENFRLER